MDRQPYGQFVVSSSAIIALGSAMRMKTARARLHVHCRKPSKFGLQRLVVSLGSLVAITLLSRRLDFWASRSTASNSTGITKNKERATGRSEAMCYLYIGEIQKRLEVLAARLLVTFPRNMILATKDIDADW